MFDGWANRAVEAYQDLQWVETGERLTEKTFRRYRAQGGWVIMHGRSESTNEWIVSQPDVIAASDGIPFSEGRAHPRGAGTFSRVLGHYVRERGVLSLMDGLRKMTIMPAQRLETVAPDMAAKGRVQVGAGCRPHPLRSRSGDRPGDLRRTGPVLRGDSVCPGGRHVRGARPGAGRRCRSGAGDPGADAVGAVEAPGTRPDTAIASGGGPLSPTARRRRTHSYPSVDRETARRRGARLGRLDRSGGLQAATLV